jgi:hypothetical protein
LFGAFSRGRGYTDMYLAAALLLALGSGVFAVWDRRR